MTRLLTLPIGRRRPGRAARPRRRLAWAAGVLAAAVGAALAAGAAETAPPLSPGARQAVYPKPQAEMEALARKDPLAFLREALRWHDERISGYTCAFTKQENIGGELQKAQAMHMKLRLKPFSLYVRWTDGVSKGQEAIYAEGKNGGKVVAHPPGILGFLVRKVLIDPNSKTALKHSRKPLTNAGMGNMLRLVIPQCEQAQARGDLTLTYEGLREVGGRPTYVFKRVLPNKHDYPCSILLVYIDTQFLLCVRSDAYDWEGQLISQYVYTDLDLNPVLNDEHFSPDNKDYGFRLL